MAGSRLMDGYDSLSVDPQALGSSEPQPGPATKPVCESIREPTREEDLWAMRLALGEAAQAAMLGEVPVGAVVVQDGVVLGSGGNRRESAQDPTAHAEIIALREAARARQSWRLCDATLVVTQEPCPMCAGALVNARIRRVVYGCPNPKAGSVRTLYRILEDPRLNHRVIVVSDVLSDDCAALLRRFFAALRSPAEQPMQRSRVALGSLP